MSAKRFGDLVRQRREELGLNQSQLAKRAKITKTTISEIESSTGKDIYASTLFQLAKALHWDAEQVQNAYYHRNPNTATSELKKDLIYQAAKEFAEQFMKLDA